MGTLTCYRLALIPIAGVHMGVTCHRLKLIPNTGAHMGTLTWQRHKLIPTAGAHMGTQTWQMLKLIPIERFLDFGMDFPNGRLCWPGPWGWRSSTRNAMQSVRRRSSLQKRPLSRTGFRGSSIICARDLTCLDMVPPCVCCLKCGVEWLAACVSSGRLLSPQESQSQGRPGAPIEDELQQQLSYLVFSFDVTNVKIE